MAAVKKERVVTLPVHRYHEGGVLAPYTQLREPGVQTVDEKKVATTALYSSFQYVIIAVSKENRYEQYVFSLRDKESYHVGNYAGRARENCEISIKNNDHQYDPGKYSYHLIVASSTYYDDWERTNRCKNVVLSRIHETNGIKDFDEVISVECEKGRGPSLTYSLDGVLTLSLGVIKPNVLELDLPVSDNIIDLRMIVLRVLRSKGRGICFFSDRHVSKEYNVFLKARTIQCFYIIAEKALENRSSNTSYENDVYSYIKEHASNFEGPCEAAIDALIDGLRKLEHEENYYPVNLYRCSL